MKGDFPDKDKKSGKTLGSVMKKGYICSRKVGVAAACHTIDTNNGCTPVAELCRIKIAPLG